MSSYSDKTGKKRTPEEAGGSEVQTEKKFLFLFFLLSNPLLETSHKPLRLKPTEKNLSNF